MKKLLLLTTLFVAFFSTNLFATKQPTEQTPYDLNGKYVGQRMQYTADQKDILQTFQYEFELKQEGNIVTGVSTIYNENGDFADILLKGIIIGDKLHFSEYQIKSENKPEERVWCFKSGELSIVADEKGTHLVGATPSFIPEYFYPCTGGYTDIVNPEIKPQNQQRSLVKTNEEGFSLSVFPNPFLDKTNISYKLATSDKVSLEILDLNGKRVALLEENSTKEKGNYTIPFVKNGLAAGILVAKLTVGKKVYSTQIVVIN